MDRITSTKESVLGNRFVISRKEYSTIVSAYEKLIWYEKEREAHNDIVTGKLSVGYATQKELQRALGKLKK